MSPVTQALFQPRVEPLLSSGGCSPAAVSQCRLGPLVP
jgi:hypothetical protein